jgi:hypothetical protein
MAVVELKDIPPTGGASRGSGVAAALESGMVQGNCSEGVVAVGMARAS